MEPEIKQRIEQIKAGQVPDGYKRTKIGIMPTEWEEKRIGDVLTQRKTLMCVSKDAPLLSFTIEEGVIEPENKKSNKRDFLIKDISTKKFALTEKGDIIYNPANLKFGAIHRNNLRRGVLSPIYGIFYGEQNSEFMGYLLHNQRFIDYAKIYTEGTVEKLKTLKADTFLRLKIVLPPLAEQEKIAKILSVQDRIIELYQRKIEELQKVKKVYLSKMFPKKGENVPEWRFPQFTDAWEQHRLSSFCNYISSSLTTKDTDENGKYDLYDANNLIGKTNKGCIDEDYITIIKDGAGVGRTRLLPSQSMFLGTMGALIPDKSDLHFLYQLIINADLSKEYTGSTIPHIYFKNYGENKYFIPSLSEQSKIGTYFRNLDSVIALHQRKLEETKKYKKALMQLLLTGIVRCK